jgi:hypothetical protein
MHTGNLCYSKYDYEVTNSDNTLLVTFLNSKPVYHGVGSWEASLKRAAFQGR